MSLVVTDQGHFVLADQSPSEPNVTLTIGTDVFNAYIAGGKDAAVLRLLADDRCISGAQVKRLSQDAHEALIDWASEGWLRAR